MHPDRAGVKLGMMDWVQMVINLIPSIPAFYASRVAVVDGRIKEVRISSYTVLVIFTLA
jgi:hypothetical protein